MIRKVLSRAAVLLPLLAVTSSVFGQAREKSWEIGVFGGANFYANELKLENAYVYGLRVGFNWRPSTEFELSLATSTASNLQQETSTLLPEHPPAGFIFSTDYTAKLNSYNARIVGNVRTDWRHWKPLVFLQLGHQNYELQQSFVPKGNTSDTTVGFGVGR